MTTPWAETIEAHRQEVLEAILNATAALVAEEGLLGVTMSKIAQRAGIGRATLYKYFPDVKAILLAWHERQIAAHLDQLATLRDSPADVDARLEAVLEAYALIAHSSRGHDAELSAFLHRDEQVSGPHKQLHELIRDLVVEAVESGALRDDVVPDELTSYCLHALAAASSLPSKAATRRLVSLTLAGMRPPR